jgi:hypothetical protein
MDGLLGLNHHKEIAEASEVLSPEYPCHILNFDALYLSFFCCRDGLYLFLGYFPVGRSKLRTCTLVTVRNNTFPNSEERSNTSMNRTWCRITCNSDNTVESLRPCLALEY